MTYQSISGAGIAISVVTVLLAGSPALAQSPPLIVVEDHGSVSALPYYEALNPPPRQDQQLQPPVMPPVSPSRSWSEADMLPVKSERLSPGGVQRRAIQAPELTPLFLIGDDDRSRAWLKQRGPALRDRNAIGLVVNVETAEALADLRKLAGGLTLSPASGDDLAGRLGLSHYPVLITATGIEQ
ncbi:integrating conjugative element protein [Shinella sp.]|uniref:integrating conjugative element protein n=1 Tax=Shinella sp. TaxID=1870904 RepID=UPI00258D508C|nr:integrating conjugative element protein [Shinella sp.]MCW5706942.1 integrating conjugative element protein [Shinella sp.]